MSSLLSRLAPAFADLAIKDGFGNKTIVEIGCGFGRWGHLIRSQVDEGGNQAYLVGCDIFPKYIRETKKHNPYDELIICDARWLPFKEKSADIAIIFEMIEHIKKEEALRVLSSLNDICKESIIVSTPLGFMSQPEIRGNKYEIHQSAWFENDLQEIGFNVHLYGLGMGIESMSKRFHINGSLCSLLCAVYPKKWAGIQICAKKKLLINRA